MVARWIVAVVCLSGCDKLFGLVHVAEVDASVNGHSDGGPTDGICPSSYSLKLAGFSTSYRYEPLASDWRGAELRCEAELPGRTHLIVIQGEDERVALTLALDTAGFEGHVWIGLSDRRVEGQFKWVTDEDVGGAPPPMMPPWGSGEPNDTGGDQDCVRMVGLSSPSEATMFTDEACSEVFGFLCECDDFPPAPQNF